MEDDSYGELKLEKQLCFALYAGLNRVTRLYRELLEPWGLTFTQYLVLLALWEREPRTIGDIAETLHVEPSAITPVVKRLEAPGWVTRSRDPSDERKVYVGLTEKGQAFRDTALDIRRELVRRLNVPERELADTRSALQRLSKARDNTSATG